MPANNTPITFSSMALYFRKPDLIVGRVKIKLTPINHKVFTKHIHPPYSICMYNGVVVLTILVKMAKKKMVALGFSALVQKPVMNA